MDSSTSGNSFERVGFLDNLCLMSFAGIAFWLCRDIRSFLHYRSHEGYLNSESFIAGIIINLVILAGVILMWNNRKAGFYIYAVFQVLWFVVPALVGSWGDTYFGLMTPVVMLTTPAFIIMYAFNFKHLIP